LGAAIGYEAKKLPWNNLKTGVAWRWKGEEVGKGQGTTATAAATAPFSRAEVA